MGPCMSGRLALVVGLAVVLHIVGMPIKVVGQLDYHDIVVLQAQASQHTDMKFRTDTMPLLHGLPHLLVAIAVVCMFGKVSDKVAAVLSRTAARIGLRARQAHKLSMTL